MNGVNKCILVGNIGRIPEVRYTQSGKAVCTLGLAINERRKEGDEWKDVVEWVNVVLWGKDAENAAKYLEKGRQVYVEGRMATRKYKDKNDVEKTSTEVIAFQCLYLGSKKDNASDTTAANGNGSKSSTPVSDAPQKGGGGPLDGDLWPVDDLP